MTTNETLTEKEARLYAAVVAKLRAMDDESIIWRCQWNARSEAAGEAPKGRNQKRWDQAEADELARRGLAI